MHSHSKESFAGGRFMTAIKQLRAVVFPRLKKAGDFAVIL